MSRLNNDEVLRKVMGLMQVLAKNQVPNIKIIFEDDTNILIQDFSREFVVRSHKLTWDEFVTTDSQILMAIAIGMQNDE